MIQSDLGGHVPKLEDQPWPAFPADTMSIALVTATQCTGLILIHEKMFESRLFFVDKLVGMGARIVLCDPHRALVAGPSRLRGSTVESPDIRAGMAMLLAALCAEGESTINNVGQIERGYERIDERLRALGAQIERVEDRRYAMSVVAAVGGRAGVRRLSACARSRRRGPSAASAWRATSRPRRHRAMGGAAARACDGGGPRLATASQVHGDHGARARDVLGGLAPRRRRGRTRRDGPRHRAGRHCRRLRAGLHRAPVGRDRAAALRDGAARRRGIVERGIDTSRRSVASPAASSACISARRSAASATR